MKATGKPRNFRSSLNSTFLFSVALPISVLLIVFSFYIAVNVKNTNINSYTNTLSLINTAVESELNALEEFSLAYKGNSKFRTFFYYFYLYGGNKSDDYVLSYKDRLVEYAQAVNSYLKLSSLNHVIGIGFIPNNTTSPGMLYHEVGSSFSPVVDYNASAGNWYDRLLEDLSSTIIEYEDISYLPSTSKALTMINTVWNNTGTSPIGFVKIDFSEDLFKQTISSLTLADDSYIEISFDDCDYSYISPMTFEKHYHTEYLHSDKHKFNIAYHIPLSDLYSGLPNKFLIALIFYVLTLQFARFSFNRFSEKVMNDYQPITETLVAYKGSNRPEKMNMDNFEISEFRELAETLSNMIDEVEYHIENEYKAAISQKKAQFRALQAEINPHFLYNTLNSLMALNRIGAKKELEQSIVALSKLFRYTCEHNDSGTTTIENEFMFLENYLKLQKLRYDERLEYRMSIDPDTTTYRIPKLILQPLVENAIVHGLEDCDHPVVIQISSSHFLTRGIGEVYLLSVVNNGCPFPMEEYKNNSRVGLSNIEDRLRTFWPNSVMIVKGGEDKLTEFHIIIQQTEGDLS